MEAEKAAFMGKITAGVTHEIKNVLAIIKESAGLVEDLITLATEQAPPPRDKVLRTLNRIAEQVGRGVDLSTSLNAFAHSADESTAGVDINTALDQTAFLCRRFARLKGITLDVERIEPSTSLTTDPLAFQMLLFRCIDALLDIEEKGAALTLRVENNGAGGAVIVAEGRPREGAETAGRVPTDARSWNAVPALASTLNIKVEVKGGPARIFLGLSGRAS